MHRRDIQGDPDPGFFLGYWKNEAATAAKFTGSRDNSWCRTGDTAVMGAPAESSGRGAAYVFVRDALGWSLQQKLEASDGLAGDSFGTSVSVSGDHVAIGAPGRSSGRGVSPA